jgi:D-3-phosphoglycerate dehydrogenase
VLPLLPQAHAILDASMKVPLRQAELGTAALLKIIVTATTGADHIDSATLKERNIPLLTLKGQKQVLNELTPAAELSWMLLMACARHLRAANKHVEAGLWDREQFPGMLLKGRTLGLIGCGRIGQWMARYATAFGMHVVGHDPHLPEKEWPATIERADLDTVLRSAHAVSIHVHLASCVPAPSSSTPPAGRFVMKTPCCKPSKAVTSALTARMCSKASLISKRAASGDMLKNTTTASSRRTLVASARTR